MVVSGYRKVGKKVDLPEVFRYNKNSKLLRRYGEIGKAYSSGDFSAKFTILPSGKFFLWEVPK